MVANEQQNFCVNHFFFRVAATTSTQACLYYVSDVWSDDDHVDSRQRQVDNESKLRLFAKQQAPQVATTTTQSY